MQNSKTQRVANKQKIVSDCTAHRPFPSITKDFARLPQICKDTTSVLLSDLSLFSFFSSLSLFFFFISFPSVFVRLFPEKICSAINRARRGEGRGPQNWFQNWSTKPLSSWDLFVKERKRRREDKKKAVPSRFSARKVLEFFESDEFF